MSYSCFSGRKFHKLLLIHETDPYVAPCGVIKRRFFTICDCGQESVKILDYILSGHTKSCGCDRRGRPKKNLIGQKLGTYLILEEIIKDAKNKSASNRSHSRLFLCECDKGNRHELTMARLRSLKSHATCLLCQNSGNILDRYRSTPNHTFPSVNGEVFGCPKCHSDNIVKNGRSRHGKQRYLCRDCKRRFT